MFGETAHNRIVEKVNYNIGGDLVSLQVSLLCHPQYQKSANMLMFEIWRLSLAYLSERH